MVSRARPPFGLALGEFRVSQFYVKSSGGSVDLDSVTVAQQCDRAANGRLRPDMADAEAAGGARKAAVRDQGDFTAHSLARQRCRRRKHFSHSRTAARPLVTNDDDLAFPVGLLLDGLEGILLAVETTGGACESEVRHACDLHDRPFRREIALQPDHTAGDG